MKRMMVLIAVGFMLIINLPAISQNFKFRFMAGIDIVDVISRNLPEGNDDINQLLPMVSYNFNGEILYKGSGSWGLAIEPGIIQKGGRLKLKEHDERFNFHYIQMPVLFNYYIVDKIYISIGPEISYLVNVKVKSKDNHPSDITDRYDKRPELSGLAGINYRISEKLDVGIRYNHGLTIINKIIWKNGEGETILESKDYNQYLQLILKFEI